MEAQPPARFFVGMGIFYKIIQLETRYGLVESTYHCFRFDGARVLGNGFVFEIEPAEKDK